MSQYRATITRAGRLSWAIRVELLYHVDDEGQPFWGFAQTWYTTGTEKWARAKAARILRRKARDERRQAEAKANAITLGSDWTAPDPNVDRHEAFPSPSRPS